MSKQEKKQFVISLMSNIQEFIVGKIESGTVPEHWDGHELRQYVTDTVGEKSVFSPMKGKRMREYRNDLMVNDI